MEHIQHAVAHTGSQVIDADALFILQLLHCLYMALCQVHHMDVIPDPGTVRRVIIIAKYIQVVQFSHCHLGNIGYQVVGDSLGILSNQSALMGADGIEIAQQYHVPLRIRRM